MQSRSHALSKTALLTLTLQSSLAFRLKLI